MPLTVGDTLPPLTGTCTSNGAGIDGSGSSATAHVRRPDRTTITRPVTVDPDGVWSLTWQLGDLSTDGSYGVEVEVTFAPGQVQTFGIATFYVSPQIA